MRAIILLVLLMPLQLVAQTSEEMIRIVKSDINASKLSILSQAMELDEQQAAKFWPLQRAYARKVDVQRAKRLAIIEDYANTFGQMSDAKATELAARSFELSEDLEALRQEVFQAMSEEISPIVAFRFLQADGQIETLIDLRLMQKIPLIKAPPETAAE